MGKLNNAVDGRIVVPEMGSKSLSNGCVGESGMQEAILSLKEAVTRVKEELKTIRKELELLTSSLEKGWSLGLGQGHGPSKGRKPFKPAAGKAKVRMGWSLKQVRPSFEKGSSSGPGSDVRSEASLLGAGPLSPSGKGMLLWGDLCPCLGRAAWAFAGDWA